MVQDPVSMAEIKAHGDNTKWIASFVGDMAMATRITKAAKQCGLAVKNFDHIEPLLKHAETKVPEVVFMDWDRLEAKCYELLQLARNLDTWSTVSLIGYVSQNKAALKEEAQRAGCQRVYSKTEFIAELEMLIARSVK